MEDLFVLKQNDIENETSENNDGIEDAPFRAYELARNKYNLARDLEHEQREYDKAEVFEERLDRDEYGQRGEIHVADEAPQVLVGLARRCQWSTRPEVQSRRRRRRPRANARVRRI